MNPANANPPTPDAGGTTPLHEGWTRKKLFFLITLALAIHLALIYAFGTRKQFVPRTVTHVPHMQLADRTEELLELDNPALFALPNPRSFTTAIWQQAPEMLAPTFLPAALACELPTPQNLGTNFRQFIQTNRFATYELNFQPVPLQLEPVVVAEPALPQRSALEITGELAHRQLLASPALPSLAINDVIAPSKIQILIDKSGNVASAVLLPAESVLETAGRTDKGDTNALMLVRDLKFAPAARAALGEVIFRWHTIPLIDTNTP